MLGLKGAILQPRGGRRSLEIRPCWDWKAILADPGLRKYLLEIRPCWDWKIALCCERACPGFLEIRPCWDWKKACEFEELGVEMLEIRPCWDWKRVHTSRLNAREFLKSDHVGIESGEGGGGISGLGNLKSDHVGIESLLERNNLQGGETWNQTMLGLKAVKEVGASQVWELEIRPCWDWKFSSLAFSSP